MRKFAAAAALVIGASVATPSATASPGNAIGGCSLSASAFRQISCNWVAVTNRGVLTADGSDLYASVNCTAGPVVYPSSYSVVVYPSSGTRTFPTIPGDYCILWLTVYSEHASATASTPVL